MALERKASSARKQGSDIIDVCNEKIRKWRQLAGGTAIVDLKSAYLQLHVAKKLWLDSILHQKLWQLF